MPQFKDALFVDPGMSTGWAFFADSETTQPVVGQFYVRKSGSIQLIEDRLIDVYVDFDSVLKATNPLIVYIESAEGRADAAGMQAAMGGSVIILSYVIGVYRALCWQHGIDCKFILRRKWAGQLSDVAVGKRIERVTGRVYREHERDAVGMGLSIAGKL